MKQFFNTLLSKLSPVLGAGAVGACPLCWAGSASLLTYLGLGALVPLWRWLVLALLALAVLGFVLDYRSHKNPWPLALLFVGGALLYVGRYVLVAEGLGFWYIWGPGALAAFFGVVYNRRLFKKNGHQHGSAHESAEAPAREAFECRECGLWYPTEGLAEKCAAWCRDRKSCNIEIIKHAITPNK